MSSSSARAKRTRQPPVPQVILTEAQLAGVLPLDWMLHVLRDANADPARRDRMAIAAAQYIHPRAADTRQSKKQQAARAAREAGGVHSEWGNDLDPTRPQ